MLERMAKHTVKEHCQVVEKSLVQELERLYNIYNENQSSDNQQDSLKSQMSFVLSLTDIWVSWKSGSLISDPVKIFSVSTLCYIYMQLNPSFSNKPLTHQYNGKNKITLLRIHVNISGKVIYMRLT